MSLPAASGPVRPGSPASTASRVLDPTIMPTLQGIGYGNYEVRPFNFVYSLLAHGVLIALVLWMTNFVVQNRVAIRQTVTELIDPNLTLPASSTKAGGGGGGGDASKL